VSRSVLGPATLLALAVGVLCTGVAGVASGGRGVLSAAAATALVLGFLWFGQLPIALAARGYNRLATAQLIIGCIIRVAVGVLALQLLFTSSAFDRRVFGVSIMVCALAWTAGAVWGFTRYRSVTVEVDLPRKTDV
jgi:ATP synthase protein I